MITRNKKAGTKLLSIWWFFVIIIVFIGVVMGTSFFKADKLDVREVESAIMVNRIIECVSLNGKFNQQIFNNTNFLVDCGFNPTIIEKSSLYFIKISVRDINNHILNMTSFGNSGFEEECKIALTVDAKKYPRCFQQTIKVTNPNGELLTLNILAGSNHEVGVR